MWNLNELLLDPVEDCRRVVAATALVMAEEVELSPWEKGGAWRCQVTEAVAHVRHFGQLLLADDLQTTGSVPFVHWSEFVTATAHSVGSDS